MDVWEEVDSKINSDNDVPVVKTSNKVGDEFLCNFKLNICQLLLCVELSQTSVFQEITSILKELRRVQRQLEGKSLRPTIDSPHDK